MKDHLVEDKDYQKKRPKWPVFYWQNVGCGSYRLCIDIAESTAVSDLESNRFLYSFGYS